MSTDTKEIRRRDTKGNIEDLLQGKEERRSQPIPDVTTLDVLYSQDFREDGPFLVKFDSEGIPIKELIYRREGPAKDGPYVKSTPEALNEYRMRMKKARREILATLKKPRDQKS